MNTSSNNFNEILEELGKIKYGEIRIQIRGGVVISYTTIKSTLYTCTKLNNQLKKSKFMKHL